MIPYATLININVRLNKTLEMFPKILVNVLECQGDDKEGEESRDCVSDVGPVDLANAETREGDHTSSLSSQK